MADMFDLKIITPDRMFYEGEGKFIEFTSVEGRMGVYPNHIPLTTVLVPCVVKIHNGDDVKKAAVMGGFVEIQKEKITMLAEAAEWPEQIDVERAESAKRRAEERLQKKGPDIDVTRAEAALRRAMARIAATR